MEFKVYMDGTQRIVSGVTLETTCKDIVLCLAQATQQFGKFILVERWRNNERLLNPNDYPIKVLSQWGEYAGDVSFVMKRCDQPLNESTVKSPTTTTTTTPTTPTASSTNRTIIQQQQQLLNDTNGLVKSNKVNQSSRVDKSLTNCTSNNKEGKKLNISGDNDHYGTSLPQTNAYYVRRPKHPPPYYEAITKSALLSSRSSPSDQNPTSPDTTGKNWSQGDVRNSVKNSSKGGNHSFNIEENDDNNQRLNIVKSSRTPEESKSRSIHQHQSESRLREAVKLTSLQKDTLNAHNRLVLELNSPVNYNSDNTYRTDEEKRRDLENEARILDRIRAEQEEHIENLETEGIDDQMDKLERENGRLEVDKKRLRCQLGDIEVQISDCRRSIEQLMDQINQLNIQKEEEEMMKRRGEEKMKRQLIEMTNEKSLEFERQAEQLKMIDDELKESDEMLKERIKKIEKILHELKEANLQGLSLLPREELFAKKVPPMKTSQSSIILNPDTRSTTQMQPQRPGSTRKMFGSPRELKNAVATSKNPHGVWV